MKILSIEQGSDTWKEFEKGKIRGTTIGKLCSKSRDQEQMYDCDKVSQTYYETLADRLAYTDADNETPAERGLSLQHEAIEKFCEYKLINIESVATDGVWQSDENSNWSCSPDAFVDTARPNWAIEVKCLSSANHIKAIIANNYPEEFTPQIINYFLINDNLDTVYFVMYDPRFINEKLKLKIFEIQRADVEKQINAMRNVREIIEERMEKFCNEYSNF